MKYTPSDLPPLLQKAEATTVKSPSNEHFTQEMLANVAHGRALSETSNLQSSDPVFFDQISIQEAMQIYSVVRDLKPNATLEIGFCCGASGLAILKALEDSECGTHYAVDPFQSSYAKGNGRRNAALAKLDHRLVFHEKFPEEAINSIPRIQFAFIDASHLFDLSVLDFVLADKRLDVGGVLAFHDLWMPSLQKLVRYILANRHYVLHPASRAEIPGSIRLRLRLKKLWARSTARLPAQARNIFSSEFMHPWGAYESSNLVFLMKTAEDDRDWRHHRAF